MSRSTRIYAGPPLTLPRLVMLPSAGGRWLERALLAPLPMRHRWQLAAVVTGIYLITDTSGAICWLGKASRDDDLVGRLDDHVRDPAKAPVFATVRLLHLRSHTPSEAVAAIEGRCADLLGLRGTMGSRMWPSADRWAELAA